MFKRKGPYTNRRNLEAHACVEGPGEGFGYYAHTLYPEKTCCSDEEAERAALFANEAYYQGKQQALREVREVLGIK